mgnify:CR=1 FL=1
MIKPGKDFRLSKESKRILSSLKGSKDNRVIWKQALIQAQLIETRNKNKRSDTPQGDE